MRPGSDIAPALPRSGRPRRPVADGGAGVFARLHVGEFSIFYDHWKRFRPWDAGLDIDGT